MNVGAADFAPVVSPATIDLVSGGEAVPVTASLAPGACSPPSSITVTPTGLPAGVTVTPASADLLAPSYTPVVFTFSAAASVPAGAVEATFVFDPSTGAPKTTTTPVSVVRNGRIGVAVERAPMDVCPGGAGGPNSLTITLPRRLFGNADRHVPESACGAHGHAGDHPGPGDAADSDVVSFTRERRRGRAVRSRRRSRRW